MAAIRRRDVGKHRIAIVQEITGRLVREGVPKLLSRPSCCGMLGDRHVDEPSTVVSQDDEHEQEPEGDGRHDEQVGGHDPVRVVREEGPPRL